ncbi:MAG: DUF4124 domain-containing protein [Xanthomonadales bacterium]|nr:DUF4124 domain-containing protein [Xanthomonadales bacterium]
MLCIVLAAGLIPDAFAEREIHVWTDENGVRYFAEVPPANTETETVQTDPAPPYGEQPAADAASAAPEARQSAAAAERRAIEEAAQKQQDAKSETLARCERHRKRLEQMLPARRVYYRDEDGNEVRMDDTQRVTLIEESREYLSKNCN